MELKRKYTLMVFPQGFDGKKLALNIVLIPRNQDPFMTYATGFPPPADQVTSFALLKPVFSIGIVKGLDEWPMSNAGGTRKPVIRDVVVDEAANKPALLQSIADDFGVKINKFFQTC